MLRSCLLASVYVEDEPASHLAIDFNLADLFIPAGCPVPVFGRKVGLNDGWLKVGLVLQD